jgi:hypothetical protein
LTRLPLAPEAARSVAALVEFSVKALSRPAVLLFEDVELELLVLDDAAGAAGLLAGVGLNV